MGIYRFILATLVMFSHCQITFLGKNEGVSAVVSFFLISGCAMTHLLNKTYAKKNQLLQFYIDRCLRLFPQFVFYLAITYLLYSLMGQGLSIGKLIINLMMLPLNFFTVYNYEYIIIPQSWSLGIEMQFYLLFPIIILYKKELPALAFSVLSFLVAFFGIVNSDYFGYRMLSGMLFVFIIGSFIAQDKIKEIFIFYILLIIILIYPSTRGYLGNGFNIEIITGLLIGVPIVFLLNKINSKGALDTFLGDLSYAIYLNHSIPISIIHKYKGNDVNLSEYVFYVFSISFLMSIISNILIESISQKYRRKIRKKITF